VGWGYTVMKVFSIIPALVAGILSAVVYWYHSLYFGDKVARYVGYPISIFGTPIIIFGIIISLELIFIRRFRREFIHNSWLWLLLGIIISYLPLAYFLYALATAGPDNM
jgi:hypothetical protein